MSGVVFLNTLRRSWKQALYWGISIGVLGYYVPVLVPNVSALKQYEDLVAKMPPLMLQAFGLSNAAQIATPAGFLGFVFFSYMLLITATYAVIAGMSITANEEELGIMDVLLSLPIPRWRIIIERFLAYTVILIVMLAIIFAGLWLGAATTPGLGLDMGRVLQATVNVLPGTLLVLAFTVLVGTIARSRTLAMGAAAVLVIASYFIDFIGAAASGTLFDKLRAISFYSWYNGGQIMFTGLEWSRVLPPLALALIFIVGSLWFFQRRDVGL